MDSQLTGKSNSYELAIITIVSMLALCFKYFFTFYEAGWNHKGR